MSPPSWSWPVFSANYCLNLDKDDDDHVEIPHQHGEIVATDLKVFTYRELVHATRKFEKDTYLGNGRYAKVYKGWIHKTSKDNTELPVAIKRLHRYKHLDLKTLKEFSHPNLVKLIGYCVKQEVLFLVYEFMPNRSFEAGLESGLIRQLPLATKVKIAIGIARGFVFLHKTREEGREDPCNRGTVDEPWDWVWDWEWDWDWDWDSDWDSDWDWENKANVFETTFAEPRVERHKMLSEDFTAKLSDYDITKIVHGHYPKSIAHYDTYKDVDHYYQGCEVLLGRKVSDLRELQKINDLFRKNGETFLFDIAKSCFEICNEVDSESKMLTILEDYAKYVPKKM